MFYVKENINDTVEVKPEHRDAELYKKELQKQTGLSWCS